MMGVREYSTEDNAEVYDLVLQQVLKQHSQYDIIKIDVWQLASWSPELMEYLEKKDQALKSE